jgi:hypothetical protein
VLLFLTNSCAISFRILKKKRSYTSKDRDLETIQIHDIGVWAEDFETKLRYVSDTFSLGNFDTPDE